jgi:hypothetical protein
MGTSTLPNRYKVNGLVDTSRTIMENLELVANSCATWITYDIMDGKWAVVINRAGEPVHTFNDTNIIGPINLSGSGLSDYYNAVEVQFPHRDLRDQKDWIRIEIPAEDRLPNEPDNVLTIDLPVINEPVQAQIVGLIELKQSRLDKIITFTTDYSLINLQAGDVVAVTNSVYGWVNKEFRIVRMEEQDQDGTIVINVTALEYSDSVYDLSDLYRFTRTNQDGIITQGAIGRPTQPQVTKFETDARPRIEIETSVPLNTDPLNPTGLVDGMEFWIYQIPTAELPTWEAVDDDTRAYTLLTTLKPTGSNVFEPGQELVFDADTLNLGNFLVKCRAINGTTTSEFSLISGLVEFIPAQVTDVVGQATEVQNDDGPIQGRATCPAIGQGNGP